MTNKNISNEKSYWNNFYSNIELDIPSQFCSLTASEIPKTSVIVEFGCGNGRDSLFLSRHGYQVMAMDLSAEAIEKCIAKAKGLENISFRKGDVTNSNDVCSLIEDAQSKNTNSPITVYSRFFLHSIDDQQEQSFLSYLSKTMVKGDHLYLEFRSSEDEKTDKIYGSHYRRYINSEAFKINLDKIHDFSISYDITGKGMAKYKSEDPFVTRIIATKR